MNNISRETKLITNILVTNKNELKKFSKAKAQYVIDLHYKGTAYLDKNINEKELQALINFFITMYGFMSYYHTVDQSEMSKKSQDCIIENLHSVITPETFNYLNNLLLLKDEIKDTDSNIEKDFINSYNNGLNLAPHCNKQYVEEKYLKCFFEYLRQRTYLEKRIQNTGNSKQLKKISAITKKHLITKNRNN